MPSISTDRVASLIRKIQHNQQSPEANAATAELIGAYRHYCSSSHARRGIVDTDDLESITTTAIWTAAKTFDLNKDAATFGTWCHTLTSRAVVSHLRRQNVLNGRSAGRSVYSLESHDQPTLPESKLEELAAEERAAEIRRLLTPLEQDVFDARRRGLSFAEIAVQLHRTVKAIDNASQRLRAKFIEHFGTVTQGLALA